MLQTFSWPWIPWLVSGSVFRLHVRLIVKKAKEKPVLYHVSCPFFYLNEYNVVNTRVAFSFVLLPTLSKPLFPPNSMCLGHLGGLDAFLGMDCNIFWLYSEYFILFIFKLAFQYGL